VFLASQREKIVALAARHRIPAIYPFRVNVEMGGLMSYGAMLPMYTVKPAFMPDASSRALKGERPADLPVQNPTKFELVINLKAALPCRPRCSRVPTR
jgi:putative ABC transport system substrate-binding protein